MLRTECHREFLAIDIRKTNNPCMNIQTLAAFVAVAREGSLTRAALKLHITQPAVGLHIKNLQAQTGLRLLTRTAQGMQLTADGSSLLPRSEEHTSELQSLMRISYAVFCLKQKTHHTKHTQYD